MEQGQSLANWMIWLRNLRILENFLGLALAKSISFTKRGKSLGHLSSFRSTGIQDSMMKFWESTLFFNQSQYHRPIECDIIGWKSFKRSKFLLTGVRLYADGTEGI